MQSSRSCWIDGCADWRWYWTASMNACDFLDNLRSRLLVIARSLAALLPSPFLYTHTPLLQRKAISSAWRRTFWSVFHPPHRHSQACPFTRVPSQADRNIAVISPLLSSCFSWLKFIHRKPLHHPLSLSHSARNANRETYPQHITNTYLTPGRGRCCHCTSHPGSRPSYCARHSLSLRKHSFCSSISLDETGPQAQVFLLVRQIRLIDSRNPPPLLDSSPSGKDRMMHRNFASALTNDTAIETAQLGPSLYSPFSYTLSVGEPNMIKQAAPQHPHELTKLQHRLLYESDSESSFDFSFSSPSSVGSTSEYSDVGYQSSTRSRTRSSGLSRPAGSHGAASRSGSISSVLGSSVAIQRVLMGTNPSTRPSRQSQRQSVRAIASAFEAASATASIRAPSQKIGSQLGRVDEQSIPSRTVQASKEGSLPSTSQTSNSLSSRSHDSSINRPADVSDTMPTRLKISKQSFQGPMSAPVTTTLPSQRADSPTDTRSDSTPAEPHFVLPPRTPNSNRWPYDGSRARIRSFISLDDQPDDDEPAFEIVPSPSRKRSVALPSGTTAFPQHAHDTQRASLSRSPSTLDSPPLPSLRSAASRDSMESSYSLDSLGEHPFSLQLAGEDELDQRVSSAASIHDAYDAEKVAPTSGGGGVEFIAPPTPAEARQHLQPTTAAVGAAVAPACVPSGSTLQPLLLSTSRPSSSWSSSRTTLTPRAPPDAASMRVNEDTCFPLPPFTGMTTATAAAKEAGPFGAPVDSKPPFQPRDLTLAPKHTVDSPAVAELKRQAAELLASIRSLSDEIDTSIPATHRLPGSAYKPASTTSALSSSTASLDSSASTTSFVAVDETYSDVWRLMDSWYWSSFEVGPQTPPV